MGNNKYEMDRSEVINHKQRSSSSSALFDVAKLPNPHGWANKIIENH